jgi:hypothetical protein
MQPDTVSYLSFILCLVRVYVGECVCVFRSVFLTTRLVSAVADAAWPHAVPQLLLAVCHGC